MHFIKRELKDSAKKRAARNREGYLGLALTCNRVWLNLFFRPCLWWHFSVCFFLYENYTCNNSAQLWYQKILSLKMFVRMTGIVPINVSQLAQWQD